MLPAPEYPKPDYAIDAPGVVLYFILGGATAILLAIIVWRMGYELPAIPSQVIAPMLFYLGISLLLTGLVMLYGSKRGKMVIRDNIIEQLSLQGHEQVLDVGCGRGLLLIGIASKLSTGRAVGIDLWQTEDQSGNAITTTEENTRRANVAERTELHTGDMREMPFVDGRFDIVISSWAIHNIPTKEGRQQALKECWRALKQGGMFAFVDISYTAEYEAEFRKLGCTIIKKQGPYFTFLIPSYLLIGRKP
jgi:ubiquinone/menaquinone biosynthesis C-methylase UbiE